MCSNYEKQLQAIQGQEAETRDQVSVWASISISSMLVRSQEWTPVFQVKKLQVMLRQANEQLERTMTDKQNLEDCVQAANKETAAKVPDIFLLVYIYCLTTFLADSYIPLFLSGYIHSLPIWMFELLKNCNTFHPMLELQQILEHGSLCHQVMIVHAATFNNEKCKSCNFLTGLNFEPTCI